MALILCEIAEKRHDIGGEALELLAAPFVGPCEVEGKVSHAGVEKVMDGLSDVLRCADGTVALGGGTHVHAIAGGEVGCRFVERLLVIIRDTCEQQMPGTERHLVAFHLLCRCPDER